jgi:predicted RNase H-like nuclease
MEGSEARFATEGKRLSMQSWAIVPKIREVDAFLRADPVIRTRIREVHPEVCFYYMAGLHPMSAGKKTSMGRAERHALLKNHFGTSVEEALADRRRLGCAADDVLDAFAGLWTARRIQAGVAETVPSNPPRDAYCLPMEMVA